jgi:hypothetical protein
MFLLIQNLMQLKISELFVQEKKELEKMKSHYTKKDHHFTKLSLNLWLKEKISLPKIKQVEDQSVK